MRVPNFGNEKKKKTVQCGASITDIKKGFRYTIKWMI